MPTNTTTLINETPTRNTLSWGKIILDIFGVLVFGAICAYGGYTYANTHSTNLQQSNMTTIKPPVTATPQITPTPSPTPSVLPTPYSYPGWKTYTDSQDQVSFAYPDSWISNTIPNKELDVSFRLNTTSSMDLILNNFEYDVNNYSTVDDYIASLNANLNSNNQFWSGVSKIATEDVTINGRKYILAHNIAFDENTQASKADSYLFVTKNNKVAELVFPPSTGNTWSAAQVMNTVSF